MFRKNELCGIRTLGEQAIRNYDDFKVKQDDIDNIAGWHKTQHEDTEIPYIPARVVLQDFTGVPSLVDLASLRNYMIDIGGNPDVINPKVPVDLIIDHSVQVDTFGNKNAADENMKIEYSRNRERYEFIRWGEQAFKNFRVFPPEPASSIR
ncbi:hypothetical protein CHS0354_035275 [Potamilus streckersoni]|uniref:Aconitase/3-isopropylmalate dehydratase large subunit alpha/beta/alpha domain-containing protein n=1 Tax=Potamilus streckersoni TaxID=2493646 RepID=A0AAE0S317_9BIVA|nr:hypothetical protein CHS0354_035275 [Potamilus streckersoni]